ncbi:MAG: hypothetical protein WKG52_04855 [Variovorax sp.]
MKPLIEIHRIGSDAFGYRISAQGADTQDSDSAIFDSLEHCLLDAGASLGDYFPRAELNFEGMFLGACDTAALRRTPRDVAQRIQQHCQPA